MSAEVATSPSDTKVELNDSLTTAFLQFDDILAGMKQVRSALTAVVCHRHSISETSASLSSTTCSSRPIRNVGNNSGSKVSGHHINGFSAVERKLSDPPANFLKLRAASHFLQQPKLNGFDFGSQTRNGSGRNVNYSRSIPHINIVGTTEVQGQSDVNSNSEAPQLSSYASNVASLARMLAETLGNEEMERNWPAPPGSLVKNPILRWLAKSTGKEEADHNGNSSYQVRVKKIPMRLKTSKCQAIRSDQSATVGLTVGSGRISAIPELAGMSTAGRSFGFECESSPPTCLFATGFSSYLTIYLAADTHYVRLGGEKKNFCFCLQSEIVPIAKQSDYARRPRLNSTSHRGNLRKLEPFGYLKFWNEPDGIILPVVHPNLIPLPLSLTLTVIEERRVSPRRQEHPDLLDCGSLEVSVPAEQL